MRSAQVAQLAGVSVRTLRHYHALGLLAEPPRQANGYREYSAYDLAELLRIKRLASLGFSLSEIANMEQTAQAGTEAEALAALDAELAAQIERLQEQRRTIAQLQAEQLDPSLPVRFARVLRRLYGEAPDDATGVYGLSDADRAMLTIVANIYDEADISELEHFAEEVERKGLSERLRDVNARIEELPADAPEALRQKLVDESLALIEPVMDCFDPTNWEDDEDERVWAVVDTLQHASLNEAQRDVTDRVEAALVAAIRNSSTTNT